MCFDFTAVDHLYGTSFHAGSAVCTFAVINGRMEIINDNRFVRTFLLAYLTAYTAVFTYELSCFTVIS